MSTIELFLTAVALSMDAFAVSICKGLSLGKIGLKEMLTAGLWFGAFQAIMPMIGYYLSYYFADMVSSYAPYVALILLVIIGGNMVKESFDNDADYEATLDPKTMFMLAIATSIDAMAVGVTFAFLKVNILMAACFIGIVTFCFSAAGIKIGSLFGAKYHSKAELAGGIILILLGLKILLEGIGII